MYRQISTISTVNRVDLQNKSILVPVILGHRLKIPSGKNRSFGLSVCLWEVQTLPGWTTLHSGHSENKAVELILRLTPKSKPLERIERWNMRLMGCNFTVQRNLGTSNITDFPSRNLVQPNSSHKHAYHT